ncbi:Translation initiation factor IF-2 [Candidatus Omnitrophus magneticus]|uniref:Translation initiation factor IF-2 n=1 Tax=Candidatus Omnitrophus magneticus TaxID=1609969 RepID=A0A0F0CT17_9BACT|nr:Translation initiation factor IF-2 [Candidatus Omnitrophus magneticus]
MAVTIKELAGELGIKTDELMESLKKLYVEFDNEDSIVNDKISAFIRIKMGLSRPPKKKAVKKVSQEESDASSSEKEASSKKTSKKGQDKASEKDKLVKEDVAFQSGASVSDSKSGETDTDKKDGMIARMIEKNLLANKIEKNETVTSDLSAPQKNKKDDGQSLNAAAGAATQNIEKTAIDPSSVIRVVSMPPSPTAKDAAISQEKSDKTIVPVEDISPKDKHYQKISKWKKQKQGKAGVTPLVDEEESGVSSWRVKSRRHGGNTFGGGSYGKRDRFHYNKPIEKKTEIAHDTIKAYQGSELIKIELPIPSSIRTIAVKVNKRPNDLLQYLINKGIFVNINKDLDEELTRTLLKDLGYELEVSKTMEESLLADHVEEEVTESTHLVLRAPVVTFMGHVDHGKTSLLDYIRKTMVTAQEKGGITQHIGAYKVDTEKGSVTFLDTPGHEAFTAMRARGAEVTDIVVLVVAADDGVMPQTKEAMDHARAANVPIVVAINKCDAPGAKPERVKIELQKEGLISEDFGGKTVMLEVSAKTGQGMDELMEMLMMESELLELKANPHLKARGVVIEAKKCAGQGVTVTVLVQNGTLKIGDIVLTGVHYGKVKAMINDKGTRLNQALPSTPVEVLGLQGVPEVGDEFFVVKDEKKAKTLSLLKQSETHRKRITGGVRITLEDFHNQLVKGGVKELKIILKADVQGSLEAINHSLSNLPSNEIKLTLVHTLIGDINESDVMLALVSNAVIIGFHVKIDSKAESLAKQENIDCRVYEVIYDAIEDIKAAMEGLLEPIEREVSQGFAQIKEVFPSKKGKVAGSMVTKGTIHRKDRIRVKRAGEVIFSGTIESLRRFKDDVREVKEGFECGIIVDNFNDIRQGDIVEAYIIEKVARRLTAR